MKTTMNQIVLNPEQEKEELGETSLTESQEDTIAFWNRFLREFAPKAVVPQLPSFPIWGFELNPNNHYPYEETNRPPTDYSLSEINIWREENGRIPIQELSDFVETWPAYASRRDKWPKWKVNFIRQNRAFSRQLLLAARDRGYLDEWMQWLFELAEKPPSSQKLEWNCKGEERDLYKHILQFRPSGLRVKRYENLPALVAMTSTQIPILGQEERFMTRSEGLRAQGFPTQGAPLAGVNGHQLPESRTKAFKALGNAVHAGLVHRICEEWLWQAEPRYVEGRSEKQGSLFPKDETEKRKSQVSV
jgi:DNA (cytosine-5)-methyltransferase 1